MSKHPIHDLDDDVHQRVRLGILASLHDLSKAEVGHLKSALELTDGNLGRHLQALEEAGLITQSRVTGSGRPRTWVKITSKGRKALKAEVRALQRLLGALAGPDLPPLGAPDAGSGPVELPDGSGSVEAEIGSASHPVDG